MGGQTTGAVAQSLAYKEPEKEFNAGEKLKTSVESEKITNVLAKLETQFRVNFNYKSDILDGKLVKDLAVNTTRNKAVDLEKTLQALLVPAGLEFEKISQRVYLIYPEKAKGQELKTEAKSRNFSIIESVITGKVSDTEGGPLPGVSVVLKGTQIGTTSNADGSYRITVPDSKGILVFSFIGFTSQEVAIGTQTQINISLKPDAKALEEVVVIGYGTQKRENVIGSIAQVSSEQLESRPVTQLSNALTGQMAGVTAIQRTGQPGLSASTINVRGVGSFGASSGALVIIDGIPGNFNDIDPNDVESVSVLKDASSAAIYGSRAANGVILVTTKTGKEGKLKINYNGYTGFQKPTAFPDFVDSWDYAAMFNEASASNSYTDADIQKYKDGSSPDTHPNTDFLGAVFSKNGLQTGHNLTLSGGTPATKYNLSLGYLFQDGLVVRNNYDRYNIRLNLTTALSSKMDLTTRLSGIKTSSTEPDGPATLDQEGVLGIINTAVRYPATYVGKLSNGYYGPGVVQKGTPISFLEDESFRDQDGLNLNANLRLDYRILTDLKLSFISAYNQINNKNVVFLASQIINPEITLGPNELTKINNSTNYYTLQGLAEYSKRINEHQIGVLLGYSFEENHFETTTAYRNDFPGNDLTELNAGSPSNQQASGTANQWALESQFGRVNYSFANRYLVEGVLRRDGSSRFPGNRKYAYFPSAAIGWRIGQEEFIKSNASWISELKLKASTGVLGNQNIGNYPYQNLYRIGTAYNYSLGGAINAGVARTTITDPNLHWESTKTTDVGMEFGFFNNKITGSATYFDRYTYDILYAPGGSVSSTLGFAVSEQNTGELSNSGFEFILGHNNQVGDFSYNINGNLSIIKNEVLDLGVGNISQPNGMVGNGSTLFIGHPMQLYYGYIADGIFVNEEDVKTYTNQTAINPGARPGDVRYKDISGPDGVPDGKVDATYDRVVLGSNIPKYNFGLNIGASYKGFDFSALLQGIAGVKGYMNNYAGIAFFNFGSIQRWQMEERWTPENPRADAGYPRLELVSNSGTPNTLLSSFWVLNGSYLRGKNVQLGYTIPKTITEKVKIGSIRLYFSGENLFTISNYRQGWDPENGTDSDAGNDANSIISNGSYYPILRNYTLGVNVRF
ncbi:SusC/RagA family TonB-linked outer membrane protein [Adhaeribacter aerolatus]|uniref:SusC/RagA family TonB-linked outer membrane protein n=2 Tax=Adhaeribacter aerolatus TaxID=670289 RepID=A0A512B3D2_9BACT|nr:SusC/RagA family TonB-linked outer membrane protein [Adhaeribacter aerolatus]